MIRTLARISGFTAVGIACLAGAAPPSKGPGPASGPGLAAGPPVLKLLAQYTKHDDGAGIISLAFAPGGRLVASADGYYKVRVWSHSPVRDVALLDFSKEGPQPELAFAPKGGLLAVSVPRKGEVRLYSTSTWREVPPRLKPGWPVNYITFSPDGRWLAGSSGKSVALWDRSTRWALREWEGHKAPVAGVAFSPDSKWLASVASYRQSGLSRAHLPEVFLWDVASGRRKRSLTGLDGLGTSVAFSLDGCLLAAGSFWESPLIVWGVPSGRQVRSLEHKWSSQLAFARGPLLFATGLGPNVRCWDASAWAPKPDTDAGGGVAILAVSADGTLVATGLDAKDEGRDTGVKVWKVLETKTKTKHLPAGTPEP